MPRYSMTGKNGQLYTIDGPEGLSRERVQAEILKRAPEAGQTKGIVEDYLEEIPLVGDFLSGAADVGLGAVQGLAGVTGAATEAFGADTSVSRFFEDIAQGARGLMSAEERGDLAAGEQIMKEAENKGILDQVVAAAKAFSKSPLTLTAQGLGSALPFAAASVATGGGAAAPLALGALTGAGTVKGSIYDSVEAEAIAAGMPEEQAAALAREAQSYLGDNADQIALGTVIGGVAGRFGLEPALARVFGQQVAKRAILRTAASEAGTEAAQAGQERFAGNLAARRAGFDVPLGRGVAGQATLEGIMGGVPGGLAGAMGPRAPRQEGDIPPEIREAYDRLPSSPTNEDVADAVSNLIARGIPEDTARTVVQRMAAQKAAEQEYLRKVQEERAAAVAERTAGAEPSAEPDITAPGMVREEQEFAAPSEDPEVVAERVRAYEAQMGGATQPDAPTPFLTPEEQQIRAARSRAYNQRQRTASSVESDLAIYGKMVAAGQLPPTPLVNSLATRLLDLQGTPSMDTLAAGEVGPILQQFFANEAATFNEVAAQKQAAQAQPAAPSRRGPPQPTDLTPESADIIRNNPVALSDYEASGGDVEALYEIAEGTYEGPSIKYSRGRRPVDTATPDMFAGAPLQEAPGVEAKREELAAQRFATDEERLARQEQFAAEMEAGQERVLAMRQREEEQRKETLGDIEYALRAQAPENAVYKVVYDPTSNSAPYKLVAETQLGKKPEEVLSAQTLQDFSDQVYGQMMELTPYIPEAPAAIQEIEERETGEQKFPTVATRMIQEFTAEVDAAREAGQIDNLQRSELLGRLRRPNAYRTLPNGRQVPNDAIAKREKEAIDAASAAANAPADQKQELAAASKEANDKLRAAVKNSLLNPARAALKSMVEMRQDEKVGAKVRIKEAERAERAATRDMRKAMESGKGVLEADVTPEREQIQEAQKEKREAKIDLAQQRVQKYRKGGDKEPGGPPKVVSVTDVQAMVDKITAQWKSTNPVVVVESVMEIDDPALRRAIMRDNALGANGLIAPDGTIYLIADNLLSMEDAKSVLFHEALGHLGLEKLFRNNLDNALVTMYRGNAKLRADTDKWRSENRGAYENDANPLARAVEEVLAERSERGQIDRSLFQKLAAIVRNFARRMGINLKISDGDVAAILSMAHDKVVNGDVDSAFVKGLRYVTAWHGSRADFDRFDTGFMGTGEGAQVFGWGLYFTDTKQIAEKQYRDRLSAPEITLGGKSLLTRVSEAAKSLGLPESLAARTARYIEAEDKYAQNVYGKRLDISKFAADTRDNIANIDAAEARIRSEVEEEFGATPSAKARATRQIKLLREDYERDRQMLSILDQLVNEPLGTASTGKLYNVELTPKDDEWLLWDEPISKQSPKVLKALKSLDLPSESEFKKGLDAINRPRVYRKDIRGYEAYRLLVDDFGGDAKKASLALLNAGIRGTKYLDGNSRGFDVENPTYNYVLFSDEDVEITAKYSKPKTTKATADELADMDASMSLGLRRATKTRDTYAMADGIGAAIKARKLKPFIKAFKENVAGFTPPSFRTLLGTLPTSGIIDWYGEEIPSLKDIDDLVLRMSNMKANIIKAAEPTAKLLDEFLLRDKGKILAKAQGMSRINSYSPDAHASAADALQNDKVMQEIEKLVLKNSNDKKLAKQVIEEIKVLTMARREVKRDREDVTTDSSALITLANKLRKTAIDNEKVSQQVEQLTEWTRRIRDGHKVWDQLGKIEGGHQLYKEMRAFYKDMFEAELALLDARIDSLTDEKQAKRLRDMRAEMMRETLSPDEAQKAGDLFYNIDANLFQKDYFPFMREGKYYLRVKENKKQGREPEFYTFYSAKERNRALEKAAARLGVDKDDKDVIVVGDEIDDLQEDISSEDMLITRIFGIVAKAKQDLATKGTADLKELMDDIYQTYLFTTPERSVRRRMMHSQEMVGYSQDLLNHFSRQVTSYANQLSKMAFAGQIRMQVEAAKDSIKDRPATKQPRLQDVIREMEERTEQEINPEPQSQLVNMLNRAAYIYYLTAPATAVIQTTSIPIRVVPRLWKDYGYVKGTAMWTKYMKVWQTLGVPRTETIKTGIGDQLHAIMPSVLGSKLINNDTERGKLLQRAARAGMERNVLETVTDTLLQNERQTAQRHREGLARTAAEAGAQTAKAMGVMFQGMENITRQISYFMTFELAYDDYKAKNPKATEEQAFDHAVRQGLDVVRNTLGEYSNWERPRIAKSNWTRALFLFKMHAIVQTKFLVQSMRALTKGLFSDWGKDARAARAGALKELSGVMMMAGMFGGLMGLPLYSVMAWALAESFDDEDDEDVRKLMGLDAAVAYDSDIMFRKWIQDKFGSPEAEGIDLADILINGPIAALTNTELASRTSLDLKNMWFREGMGGDNTANSVLNALAANVAGASMAVSLARGYDDFVEGNIESGMKKIAPAFFRSWVTTADQASRGVVDNKGNTIIPKEDIAAYDSARSLLGFRPMDLARWQDYYITRAKNDKRIDQEKTAIMRKLDKKLREGDIATQQDFAEFWAEEIEPFNRTYPNRDYVITMESIKRSLAGREDVRERTYRGMQLDKKTAAMDYEMAKGFLPQ